MATNTTLGCLQVAPLFAPLSCRHFASDVFERRHHIARAAGFSALLSSGDLAAAADYWQFKVAVDHSQARLLKPGSFSHDDSWESGALLDGASIKRALRRNLTVVLHNVELYHRPIGLLSLALMRAFGVYAQANVYYSPAGLPSAVHAHQDAQSVFIVQCEGRKAWELFAPPQRWRLRYNQRGKAGDIAPESELHEPVADEALLLEPCARAPNASAPFFFSVVSWRATLSLTARLLAPTLPCRGDVLFLPRGLYHRTATLVAPAGGVVAGGVHGARAAAADAAAPSLHVTIGLETDTDHFVWLALLQDAAAALALPEAKGRLDSAQWTDEALREALPLPLCRLGGSFESSEPHAALWLAHARELLHKHAGARPEAAALRRALDGALRTRQEHVEAKRRQLLDFIAQNSWPRG